MMLNNMERQRVIILRNKQREERKKENKVETDFRSLFNYSRFVVISILPSSFDLSGERLNKLRRK